MLFSKKSAPAKGAPALSTDQLVTLAIEHWRIATALGDKAPAAARHGLRKIGDLLQAAGIEAQSLDHLPHDPGMSAQVVDRVPDTRAAQGDVIIETLSPLVMLNGQVIRQAEIVVGCAP
jgi:hypothetical protein